MGKRQHTKKGYSAPSNIILLVALVFYIGVTVASTCVLNYWIQVVAASICLLVVVRHLDRKQRHELNKVKKYSNAYYSTVRESEGQEELRFTKSLQWNVMYYVLALMGALFVLSDLPSARWDAITKKKLLIFSISLAAFIYGIHTILNIMVGLRNVRLGISRTKAYRQKYATRDDEYEFDRKRDINLFRDFEYHLPFLLSMLAILLLIFYRVWPDFHILINRILN